MALDHKKCAQEIFSHFGGRENLVSAARVFGGNIFLGGVVGLCMIHSGLINAWSVASYEGAIYSLTVVCGLQHMYNCRRRSGPGRGHPAL